MVLNFKSLAKNLPDLREIRFDEDSDASHQEEEVIQDRLQAKGAGK